MGDKEAYEFFPELKKLQGLAQIKYYLKHIMFDQVPDVLNSLEKVLQDFPADIIISDTFMIAGNWITELDGPPSIRVSVLPLSLPGKDLAPFGLGLLPGESFFSKLRNNLLNMFFEKLIFKDVQKHVNKIRENIGLPAYDKYFFDKGYDIPSLVLHLSTPAFEYSRKEFPDNFRFIGPVLVPPKKQYKLPDWWSEIDENLPVVLVNQGTIAKNHDDLIYPANEGLKEEKVNVVFLPVNEGDISSLPDHMYTAPYIPFGNLLPVIDLMITNGGFGGTQNALAHGIPLIVAGATEDKMEVAARVEKSGAGINLRKQNPTPEDIKKAVIKILSEPSYKQKAKELQADFAKYDSPILAVELIEELIKKRC